MEVSSTLLHLDVSPTGFLRQTFWGPHLSSAHPRGLGAWCGVPAPCSSGRSTGLVRYFPIHVAALGMGFLLIISVFLTHLVLVLVSDVEKQFI